MTERRWAVFLTGADMMLGTLPITGMPEAGVPYLSLPARSGPGGFGSVIFRVRRDADGEPVALEAEASSDCFRVPGFAPGPAARDC
jgi:hypothetical protein